jgi:3-deoxy-manno-octulosonate cytidylyltransferase (CMP-KDO synthetase)
MCGMVEQKIIGVIPVRLESLRLPGKALLDIAGKPMIDWVYLNAARSPLLEELLVATDSPKILDHCASQKIPAMETGRHRSGSDRLHEVVERTDGSIYVNIQGDEPTVQEEHIELLVSAFSCEQTMVSTLKVEISEETAQDPNVVKVVTDASGRALYFSRHAIPFTRGRTEVTRHFKHLGLYAFRREAILQFHALEPTPLEKTEKLEQLRFLENGIPIKVLETQKDTIGVDTPEDLEQVRSLFEKRLTS